MSERDTTVTRGLREIAFDEVFDAQATFRVVLEAMSRPGELFRLPGVAYERTPDGLHPHATSVVWSICDGFVTLFVDGPQEWQDYLEVNTGVVPADLAEADIVVARGASSGRTLRNACRGSLEFPEEGATVVVLVHLLADSLAGAGTGNGYGRPAALTLRGPGIRTLNEVRIVGLDPDFVPAITEASAHYPIGVDVILVDEAGRVVAIPRSCNVEAS